MRGFCDGLEGGEEVLNSLEACVLFLRDFSMRISFLK